MSRFAPYVLSLIVVAPWCAQSHAAEPLPPQLAGTWIMATAPAPAAGGQGQLELYFRQDGAGMLVGFAGPGRGTGAQPASQFAALPVQATLEGDALVVRPVAVDDKFAEELARMAPRMTLTCLHDARMTALACTEASGVRHDLQRVSEQMTAELADSLAIMKARVPARYWQRLLPETAD